MDVIIANNDKSYFLLYKKLNNKKDIKYLDVFEKMKVDKLIIKSLYFNSLDTEAFKKLISCNKIDCIIVENPNTSLLKTAKQLNVKIVNLQENKYFVDKMNQLKSYILLKSILENSKWIINSKIVIIGKNEISKSISELFDKLKLSYSLITDTKNLNLSSVDSLIITESIELNYSLFFNLKDIITIYDLSNHSFNIDRSLLNYLNIKYLIIKNVDLHYPHAKCKILEDVIFNETL